MANEINVALRWPPEYRRFRMSCPKHQTDWQLRDEDCRPLELDMDYLPSPPLLQYEMCNACLTALEAYQDVAWECATCCNAEANFQGKLYMCPVCPWSYPQGPNPCPDCQQAKREYDTRKQLCTQCGPVQRAYWRQVDTCSTCNENVLKLRREIGACPDCQDAKKAAALWKRLHDAGSLHEEDGDADEKPVHLAPFTPFARATASEIIRADWVRIYIAMVLIKADQLAAAKKRGTQGECERRSRGRPSKSDCDELIRCIAMIFRRAGGKPEAKIAQKPGAKPRTPFSRFLFIVWEQLPKSIRPVSPQEFVARAREVLAKQRNKKGQLLAVKGNPSITLKVVAKHGLGGHKCLEELKVPSKDGIEPWDHHWQRALRQGDAIIIQKK